jgi:hypothetical protein
MNKQILEVLGGCAYKRLEFIALWPKGNWQALGEGL